MFGCTKLMNSYIQNSWTGLEKGQAQLCYDINTIEVTTRELKRAYQELVLRFHPDKTGGKECEAFINVQVCCLETF